MAKCLGIGKKIAVELRRGKCARQIAEELNCRQEYVRTVAQRRGIPLPSGFAYLRELREAARPIPEEKGVRRLRIRRAQLRQDPQVGELLVLLGALSRFEEGGDRPQEAIIAEAKVVLEKWQE